MITMTNRFSKTVLPQSEVKYYVYEEAEDLNVPPALWPTITKVEIEYSTNETRVLGCVSYSPDDISVPSVPIKLRPLIYVVRLKTSHRSPASGLLNTGTTRHCDVHIYSNPLLHIYSLMHVGEVGNGNWTLKVFLFDQATMQTLQDFKSLQGSLLYRMYRTETYRITGHDVRRSNIAEHLTDPLLVNRDGWDLLSASFDLVCKRVVEAVPSGTKGRLHPYFPNVTPVVAVTGTIDRFLVICRCVELCTGRYYDAHYRTGPGRLQLGRVILAGNVYAQFTSSNPST